VTADHTNMSNHNSEAGYAGPIARVGGAGRATVVAFANQKGGVGKTTTTVSVGAALAQGGARVLLVDLDPQGNASTGLDVRISGDEPSTYDVIVEGLPIDQAVRRTAVEGLDVLPSSLELAGAEVELVQAMARERALARAIDAARPGYDLILIDCPPSLGLLTINAFVAADQLLVPIQCEYYALEGLSQLLRTVGLVEQNLNSGLAIGNVVLTMFDARTRLAQQVVDEVRSFFGERAFATVIPRTVRLSEAPSYAQPITVFDPESKGAQAYFDLAAEIGTRLGITSFDVARARRVAAATKAAELAQLQAESERGEA
jgi:chromosome partitioning protein